MSFISQSVDAAIGERGKFGEHGNPFVEQFRQQPEHARLGLPAKAQEQKIVLRKDAVHDLGNDRVPVADDPRKQLPLVRPPVAEEPPIQQIPRRSHQPMPRRRRPEMKEFRVMRKKITHSAAAAVAGLAGLAILAQPDRPHGARRRGRRRRSSGRGPRPWRSSWSSRPSRRTGRRRPPGRRSGRCRVSGCRKCEL
mgnify:CR=1 FL=1